MHVPPRNRISTFDKIVARPRRRLSRSRALASRAKRLAVRLIGRAWDDDCPDRERELLEEAAVVLRAQARVIETTRTNK